MTHILLPLNDGGDIDCALKHVIERHRTQPVRLFLLNVQMPVSRFVARFVSKTQLAEFHRESGMQILQPMIARLDEAGITHQGRIVVGHRAECIARFAREYHCDQIVVPRQKSLFENFGLGSVGSQLHQLIGADGRCGICEVY